MVLWLRIVTITRVAELLRNRWAGVVAGWLAGWLAAGTRPSYHVEGADRRAD